MFIDVPEELTQDPEYSLSDDSDYKFDPKKPPKKEEAKEGEDLIIQTPDSPYHSDGDYNSFSEVLSMHKSPQK
jgi:hypothetical protein